MKHPRMLILFLIAGVFLLAGVVGMRVYQTLHRQDRLCDVLHALVARSGTTLGKPGSAGYFYYQEHPSELTLAKKQNRQFLESLPC